MNVDLERVRRLVARDYTPAVEEHYGVVGMRALRQLALALDEIHDQLACELLSGGLTVFVTLDSDARPLPADRTMRISADQLPGLVEDAATVQVVGETDFLFLPECVDPFELAEVAVVYHFDGADKFAVDGDLIAVDNPTSFPSVWGVPTFFDLQDALHHYRDQLALRCRCPYLSSMWFDENRRWILMNKPEHTMQASLHLHLVSTLRGHKRIEVRREQPAGGTKPPDIKVTWTLTNRLAFIEVKWMGASAHATEPRISWRPDEREANEGARQLARYLDANAAEAPEHQTMGFLVVFDGRRGGVEFDTTTLTREQALHYLARDVVYDPDYAALRHDFAPPVRCFMYPLKPAA
jgi:hypothetical protein